MQIVQKIISTLLALQLLVSFGLCGGLCCLASINPSGNASANASAAKVESQKPEEATAEMSHCPLHTRKAAETKSQHTAMALVSNHNSNASAGLPRTNLKTLRNTDCCLYRGSAPDAEPSQASTTLQTHKHFAVIQPAPWRECFTEESPSPSPPKPSLNSSPPHVGFQLSLRI